MAKKKQVEKKDQRMVVCWKCGSGMMVRRQGEANGEVPICTIAKVIISDPFNPPKSCPVAQGWASE